MDCVQNSPVPGEKMTFGKDESLHIIKIASESCYTSDETVANILNDMNENVDGTFYVAAGMNVQ